MMNRRQFVYGMTCAAGTLTFARAQSAFAAAAPARYDLIVKGGRVIDPSVGLDVLQLDEGHLIVEVDYAVLPRECSSEGVYSQLRIFLRGGRQFQFIIVEDHEPATRH